jgi:GNAT superfamily N-acetyltransferase
MPDLVIRPAVQDDLEVLWDFLAMAAYEPDAEAAKAVPRVAKYLVGWQRPGDFGFIAEQNGENIGAAWARRFSAEELKFPYGDEEAPKVSIGVKPNARGQGVGEKLMRVDRRGRSPRAWPLSQRAVRKSRPSPLRARRLLRHPRFRCHEPRWRHVDRHGTEALILILSIGLYTTGMEHSPTSATGTGWERTPWHATQRAEWNAHDHASRQ